MFPLLRHSALSFSSDGESVVRNKVIKKITHHFDKQGRIDLRLKETLIIFVRMTYRKASPFTRCKSRM
jgi:hypothetical protein